MKLISRPIYINQLEGVINTPEIKNPIGLRISDIPEWLLDSI